MHLSRTLLPALVAFFPVTLGNPLKIGLSAQVTDGNPISEVVNKELALQDTEQVPMDKAVISTTTTFSNHAISPPGYKDTAKILFWNDVNFRGDKKRYQVFDDKCYNLPKNLINYVVSAKLEPKIWYCTFFPKAACEADERSEEVHQLPAGEYDFLFPDGMDFVSFKCKLYEKAPGPSAARSDNIPTSKSLDRQPDASSSFAGEISNKMLPPFAVQLFTIPDFQGPSSVKDFVPGRLNCLPLITQPETSFGSIALGEAIRTCYFYPRANCDGPAVLQRGHSDRFVQTIGLDLRSIRCERKFDPPAIESVATYSINKKEEEVNNVVPSVQLYLDPGFEGPVSNIPYYPGTWGCVPLQKPEEFAFHSIRMSPDFQSCKFYPDMACHGNVLLEIKETAPYVSGTERLPIRTMYCSFES